jgi:hypothetical protein
MIYFVVRDVVGRYPITMFLAGWGKRLARHMRVLDYDSLFRERRLRAGTYIFSDLDYLDTKAIESATACWEAIRESGVDGRLMNHPAHVLRRYDLLRRLYERGVNDYNVHRLGEDRARLHFPVFLRVASDHEGPRSGLIPTREALEVAIAEAETSGEDVRDWIVTGFGEYRGEDGLYRKYGAFNVGGRIVPRHMIFGHDWMVKRTSRAVAGATLEEEREYIDTNPHEAELREIFATAQIDYGRIDYTVHDGHIRVFEINTNPQTLTPGPSRDVSRRAVKARFAERFVAALEACNSAAPEHQTVPVQLEYAPVRLRGVSMVERTIAFTSAIGLERFEPQIFRRLFGVRAFWRDTTGWMWAHIPVRVRHALRQLRHG